MKNDVFNARMKITWRMQWWSNAKMTKRGVRIAYRSEIAEREGKIGRVKPLPSVSHTRDKAYVRWQGPAYAGPSPRTQSLKNRDAYLRTELHTHKYKLCTQAQAHAHRSTNKKSSLTFPSMYHPKSILNVFLPLLMCQVFIYTHPTTKSKHLHNQKHIKTGDQRETWKWEKFEKLTDSTIGMWFPGQYVNVGGSINLTAPLQWVRRNTSEERT